MTIRTLKLGDSEDVWMWDDAETPFAIATDAPISAPNVVTVDLSGIELRLTALEEDTTLSGRIDPLEADLTAGVSGSFTTVDGKTVTVTNGRITAIV